MKGQMFIEFVVLDP